jgi:hypothetical protein
MQFFGVIALVAVIGFTMAACGDDPANDGTKPKFTVTFNATDGTVDGMKIKTVNEVESGKTLTPPVPVPNDGSSEFWGWFPNDTVPWGNQFTASTPVTENLTVYARWESEPKPQTFTVTFNANGGTFAGGVVTWPVTVFSDEVVNPLPPATRGGHSFSSWNTLANGTGTAFTSSTWVTSNMTVYAQWTQDVTGGGSFNIGPADVYTVEWDEEDDLPPVYTKVTDGSYNGNYSFVYDDDDDGESIVPLSTFLNGPATATVANNRLTINLGTPKPGNLMSITANMPVDQPGITISNRNAKTFYLGDFYTQDGRTNLYYSFGGNGEGGYFLIYTDSAVTVTGNYLYTGTWTEEDEESGEEIEYEWSQKMIYAMNMKQGWNYVSETRIQEGDSVSLRYETAQPGSDAKWVVYERGGMQKPDRPSYTQLYPYKQEGNTLIFNPMGQGNGERAWTPDDPECPKYDLETGTGGIFPVGKWVPRNGGEWYHFFANGDVTRYYGYEWSYPYTRTGNASSGTISYGGWEIEYIVSGNTLIFNPMLVGDGQRSYTPSDPECPRWNLVPGTGGSFPVGKWMSQDSGGSWSQWVEFTAAGIKYNSENESNGTWTCDTDEKIIEVRWSSW